MNERKTKKLKKSFILYWHLFGELRGEAFHLLFTHCGFAAEQIDLEKGQTYQTQNS
jgi:hypothetical protein